MPSRVHAAQVIRATGGRHQGPHLHHHNIERETKRETSVVDPNTLDLDPETLNFGPFCIRIRGYVINLVRKI